MKIATFVNARSTPRLLALLLAGSLCAVCDRLPAAAEIRCHRIGAASPDGRPSAATISENTGRTNNAPALRALSPIFH